MLGRGAFSAAQSCCRLIYQTNAVQRSALAITGAPGIGPLVPRRACSDDPHRTRQIVKLMYKLPKSGPRPSVKAGLIVGIRPCMALLEQNKRQIHRVYVKDTSTPNVRLQDIVEKAYDLGVDICTAELNTLKYLADGQAHQGVIIDCDDLPVPDIDPSIFIRNFSAKSYFKEKERYPLWLYLDQVKDAHNYGAILRSAMFFGVEAVLTPHRHSAERGSGACKASAGALEAIQQYNVNRPVEFLQAATRSGWDVVGTVDSSHLDEIPQKVQLLEKKRVTKPTILVVGSEAIGLRPQMQNSCSSFVTIGNDPTIPETLKTLNVSVATGICLFHLSTMARTKGRRSSQKTTPVDESVAAEEPHDDNTTEDAKITPKSEGPS